MGFFGVLCCCFRHRGRSYSIDYSHDIPRHAVSESAKANEEKSKEPTVETAQPVKQITPPPAYIADTSLSIKTVPSNADALDSASEACQQTSDTKTRAIKPLPKRNEPKATLKHAVDKGEVVTLSKETGPGESKDISKDKKSALYLGEAADIPPPPVSSQPYVFVAGNGALQFPSKDFPSSSSSAFGPASTSSSALNVTAFPAPTAVFGLSDSTRVTSAPRQSSTPLPIRSSATVSSNAPAPSAVFGLTSSTLPRHAPTQSTHTSTQSSTTSTQSSNTSTQSTNPPTQSTTLTIPSSSIAPPPVYTPDATTAATGPPRGTHCPSCSAKNSLYRTGSNNPLNAGRQYRKCTSCNSWNGFTDTRGLTPGLYCGCTPPTELRLMAINKQDRLGRREAFYSCQYKACGAWERHMDGSDTTWFTEAEIREMIRDGRI